MNKAGAFSKSGGDVPPTNITPSHQQFVPNYSYRQSDHHRPFPMPIDPHNFSHDSSSGRSSSNVQLAPSHYADDTTPHQKKNRMSVLNPNAAVFVPGQIG